MKNGYFSYEWPRDGIKVNAFVHEISNYRYHWHREDYELNILLRGNQDFCVGPDRTMLAEDDVLLIPPGKGHGSFAQQPGTRALVFHFNAAALRPLAKKGCAPDFCLPVLRDTELARELRFHAAKLYLAAAEERPELLFAVKGALFEIIAALYRNAEPVETAITEEDDRMEQMRRLTEYVDAHYAEKVTLEDLADYTLYNRTYISTIFKTVLGVGFHEYLTRVRFQHSLVDLAAKDDRSLTEIALSNGFSDLKSFNKFFKEALGRSPAEYRREVETTEAVLSVKEHDRKYISPAEESVQRKLREYTRLG